MNKHLNKRILCVDDDEHMLTILKMTLSKYEVKTFTNARAALREVDSSHPFAVVISDEAMPEMNGIEFLCEIEQRTPETMRVMLTGLRDRKTALQAVNKGHVFRFLDKPCPPAKLIAVVQEAIEEHHKIAAKNKGSGESSRASVEMFD